MTPIKRILKRVELQRESVDRSKYEIPYEGFVERNNLAINLLEFVGTKTRDEKLRLEAKKYLVIAKCECDGDIFQRNGDNSRRFWFDG